MAEGKRMECEDCNFIIQSHDEKEVFDVGKSHIKKAHKGMKVSDDQIRAKMEDAQ